MNVAERNTVFLGLGSNVGDRADVLRKAVAGISQLPCTTVGRCSSIYETEPWGDSDQPAFLNCALEITTGLDPTGLLTRLKDLEIQLGRVPTRKYGPRVLDIDILVYGSLVLETEALRIPHPMLGQRRFVLVPLAELCGEGRCPRDGRSFNALLAACDDTGRIEKTPLMLST